MNRSRYLSSLGIVLLILAAGTIPAHAASDAAPAVDLDKFLREYQPAPSQSPTMDTWGKSESDDVPPVSEFASRTDPVVRVMPPSYDTSLEGTFAPYTWPGRTMVVWGRVDGGTPPYTFQMEFGDGTPPVSGNVDNTAGRRTYYIAVAHAYATAGPKLASLTVTDAASLSQTRSIPIFVQPLTDETTELWVRRNASVRDGLRWLYLKQQSNGAWSPSGGSYWPGRPLAATGAALACFEINGHVATNDWIDDIYAEFVRKGLEYLFSGLVLQPIGPQAGGNPDTNGDGYGIRCGDYCGAYQHGLVMYGIALSREPAAHAVSGPAGIAGRSYLEILTNMVDQLAWSQGDAGADRGGWRYNVCTGDDDADNSAVQWATIGLDAAARPQNGFEIQAPDFVKTYLRNWLDYSRCSNGGYAYDVETYSWCNIAKTGSGIFSEYYLGRDSTHVVIQNAVNFLNTQWCASADSRNVCEQFYGNFYAVYAVKKALEDLHKKYVGAHRWHVDYIKYLCSGYSAPCGSNSYHQIITAVPTPAQTETDGRWPGVCYVMDNEIGATTFALLTLIPGLSCDLFASGTASPQQVCPLAPVTFDGSTSYTNCADHEIVSWLWDFDDSDGAAIESPDASGHVITFAQGYPLPPDINQRTYHATLWVIDRDNSGMVPPDTATTIIDVLIDRQNHIPIACLNGPFTACVGDSIFLDACCSYDPDGQGVGCEPDQIIEYRWDLFGDGSIDFVTTSCRPDTFFVFSQEQTMSVVCKVVDSHQAESQAVATLAWSSRSDLHLTESDITFDPPTPVDCPQPVEICAQVHALVEAGAPPIPEAVVRIYHDEIAPLNLISAETLTNLQNGDVRTVCTVWTIPDDAAHSIFVVADADNQVQECVETDNLASRPLECGCVDGQSLALPTVWDFSWIPGDPGTVRWYLGSNSPSWSVNQIDQATLRLNGTVAPLPGGVEIIPPFEGFTDSVLVARFNRGEAVQSIQNPVPGLNEIRLTGGFLNTPSVCLDAVTTVQVEGSIPTTAVPSSRSAPDFLLKGIVPNPTTGATDVEFSVPRTGQVRIEIYDATGRLLRQLCSRTFEAGVHSVSWNGRDSGDHQVAAGVYFMRSSYENRQLLERLVVVQ